MHKIPLKMLRTLININGFCNIKHKGKMWLAHVVCNLEC